MAQGDGIKTIVVVDLEVTSLPKRQGNDCDITEICFYAIPAKYFTNNDIITRRARDLPRDIEKLTLLFKPKLPILTDVSGLDIEMLSERSEFNMEAADCIERFLNLVPQPICMVAHNGLRHDFPIIRHAYEKINRQFPPSIYVVDSFKAFREIDEKFNMINQAITEMTKLISLIPDDFTTENIAVIGQAIENLEILRPTINDNLNPENIAGIREARMQMTILRYLFTDNFSPITEYPPRGTFKLGNIYESRTGQEAENLHQAEGDVIVLSKLILHYGTVFLAYTEERKQLFETVLRVDEITN